MKEKKNKDTNQQNLYKDIHKKLTPEQIAFLFDVFIKVDENCSVCMFQVIKSTTVQQQEDHLKELANQLLDNLFSCQDDINMVKSIREINKMYVSPTDFIAISRACKIIKAVKENPQQGNS